MELSPGSDIIIIVHFQGVEPKCWNGKCGLEFSSPPHSKKYQMSNMNLLPEEKKNVGYHDNPHKGGRKSMLSSATSHPYTFPQNLWVRGGPDVNSPMRYWKISPYTGCRMTEFAL